MSERIGHFQILETLGRGGMGEVYVALDEVLERKVAMKSIRADRRLNASAKARFLREARVLSSLNHPHICRIYDYVETPDSDYLVLELIEGQTLQRALRDGIDRATALRFAEQIARVLIVAHAAGVVHRDLKPDNVMITPSGDIKVLDFGIARQVGGPVDVAEPPMDRPAGDLGRNDPDLPLDDIPTLAIFEIEERRRRSQQTSAETQIGQIIGTPMFMSPEQAWGRELTAASDMYSFGLLMQMLFTGRPPYDGSTDPNAVLALARHGEARPVTGVGRDLGALIRSLRALDPAARPTAAQAAERLRWIRDKPKRRIRNGIIAAILAIAALGAFKYTIDLRRERTQAVEARNDAEDMLEFMLGDLRDRLAPVGRLDVMDAVADEALEYFMRQGDALDDEDLFRRVRTLRVIGEVRRTEGNPEAATAAFTEMRNLASDLVARDPANGDWQMELGAAVFYIGALALEQSRYDDATTEFDSYHDVATTLVELDSENPDYQMELAYAYTNRSAVHQAREEYDAAITAVERANDIKRKLLAIEPSNRDYRRSLCNGLSWMAAALDRRDDYVGALAQYEEELALRKQFVEEAPRDTMDRRLLATSYSHVATAQERVGRPDRALPHLRAMRSIGRELVQFDPENAVWRRQLAISHRYMARCWLSLGALDDAAAEIAAGQTAVRELLTRDPENPEWQLQDAHTELLAARVANASRRWADAEASTTRSLERLNALEPEPFVFLHQSRLHAIDHDRLHAMGWPARAHEAATRALTVVEPVATNGLPFRTRTALALLALGRIDEAQTHLDDALAGQADDRLRLRQQRRQLEWLAGASVRAGDHAGALVHSQALLELWQLPGDDPEPMTDTRQRANANIRVGSALRRLGRPEAAILHFEAAADMAGALITAHSGNTLNTLRHTIARRELGGVLGETGEFDAAADIFAETRATLESIVARETASAPLWRYELIELLREEIELALRRERWADARSTVAAALERVLSATADPDDRSVQLQFARLRVLEGHACFGAGEPIRAGAAWGRALDAIEPIARDSGHPAHRTQLAITLLLLDRIDEATPLMEELLAAEPVDAELARIARRKGLIESETVAP